MNISRFLLLSLLTSGVLMATKEQWKSRTIYQIITDRFARTDGSTGACSDLHAYCGGTFKGIEKNLDYIKNLGFDAIWISPIPENYGNDYHGYGALNWENVNPHFGTKDDLKSLVNSAHSKGIWVMLDVVANHVAYIDEAYELVTPFNQAQYYHAKCQINNWNDQNEVEYCRLANLPDLDQTNQFVHDYLLSWVKNIVAEFSFDGIRVDTVPEVSKSFWTEYAASAGVFQIGECFNGDLGYVGGYQQALDSMLNYPLYFSIKNAFNYKQSMFNIRNSLSAQGNYFKDTSVLGTFVDNHDNQRFLCVTNSVSLLKSAVAYSLFGWGIPIIYYGTEQLFHGCNDPENREVLWTSMNPSSDMYSYIATLNSIRKQYSVWNEQHIERWADDHFYAFTRGQVLIALTNDDSGATQQRAITYHPYNAGATVCNVMYTGDCVTVGTDGSLSVTLLHGEVKVFVPKVSLNETDMFLQ